MKTDHHQIISIGIDPGFSGAVAIIYLNNNIQVFDTPCIEVGKSGGGKKKEYLVEHMADILTRFSFKGLPCHIFIEKISAMPKQGVVSMFSFGKGYGIWLGIIAAFQIPHTKVTPQSWKKHMMLGKADKEASPLRACELYPNYANLFTAKRGEVTKSQAIGRADAVLIATYGQQK